MRQQDRGEWNWGSEGGKLEKQVIYVLDKALLLRRKLLQFCASHSKAKLYLYDPTFIIFWPGKKYAAFSIFHKSGSFLVSPRQWYPWQSVEPNSPFPVTPLRKTGMDFLFQPQFMLILRKSTSDPWVTVLISFRAQPSLVLGLSLTTADFSQPRELEMKCGAF